MEINDIFAQTEFLQYLMTIAASATILILAALISMTGLKLTVKQSQQVRYYFRQYYARIRAQVDQPTDAIPQAADKILDRLIEANWNAVVSAFAVALVDAANKRIDPPQEAVK